MEFVLVDDALVCIFNQISWCKVKQKELCLVCKQWQRVLENGVCGYDLDVSSLSIATIQKRFSQIEWNNINYELVRLSADFMELFINYLPWYPIVLSQKMSEDRLEQYYMQHADPDHWRDLSWRKRLSEEFMTRHADKLDWSSITKHQAFGDQFIDQWAELLDWRHLTRYRPLSLPIVEKYAEKIEVVENIRWLAYFETD